jgi:hypothetical protein
VPGELLFLPRLLRILRAARILAILPFRSSISSPSWLACSVRAGPFPRCGVASPQAPDPDLESLPETISPSIRIGADHHWLAGTLGASHSTALPHSLGTTPRRSLPLRLLVSYVDCLVLSSFYRVGFESKRVIPAAMRSWVPPALLDARGCMWQKERPGIWCPAQRDKFAARRGADRRT